MKHTQIVKSNDLSRFADSRISQEIIPELLYLLIRVSALDIIDCRIPYGDDIILPGMDGVVNCYKGFSQFVPDGISYWEIGTGRDPQQKATADFKKRTETVPNEEKKKSTFVFVTPRSGGPNGWTETDQRNWISKRKNCGWKQILLIDGVKLADWLREFPGLGRWLASKIGLTTSLSGITTPVEHWELIISNRDETDLPLPPELFTIGRDLACESLQKFLDGGTSKLFFLTESEYDVEDFVSAYLHTIDKDKAQGYINRCLFIKDEESWLSVAELHKPHILIASTRLGLDSVNQDLQTAATSRGHKVIIPLYGSFNDSNSNIIKLTSPSQIQIEEVLKDAKFTDFRSQELAKIGSERLSALRRHLLGLESTPPYIKWKTSRELAKACLVGQWNANNVEDTKAIEKVIGKDYTEWIDNLSLDIIRSDSPLIQNNENWRIISRIETWNALGNRITDNDLDNLKDLAIKVLEEKDPKLDLSKEKRFAGEIYGKRLIYSKNIREGLSESLALIGSYPQALTSCSNGKAEIIVGKVVQTLLKNANWERWASLQSHLPMLAEAAPNEFLDAVESSLMNLSKSPFKEVFSQESSSGFGGENYMTGLLWALESLAWNPDNLSRVSIILADIASIDPGGNWANRASNSLRIIFLPWFVQTIAPIDKRIAALNTIILEQPEVGWNLLIELIQNKNSYTTGSHKPIWRNYIPKDWNEGVLVTDYINQIEIFSELALNLAKKDSKKISQLIRILDGIPNSASAPILNFLETKQITNLPENEIFSIWMDLSKLVRRHKKFYDADWSFPKEIIDKISNIANSLTPKSLVFRFNPLFSERDHELFEKKGDHDLQEILLENKRKKAIEEIFNSGGLNECMYFAKSVTYPEKVGRLLEEFVTDKIENELLSLLETSDESEIKLIGAFIWERYRKLGISWVDAILKKDLKIIQFAIFLSHLPFEEIIWNRVSSALGNSHEFLYWEKVIVNPYGSKERDLSFAIEKLIEYGREGDAVRCSSRMARNDTKFNVQLAILSLLKVLESNDEIKYLDSHDTAQLIKRIQNSEDVNKDDLFQIEWSFLPWLDQDSFRSPLALEMKLASDPEFFVEVLSLAYRSKKEQVDLNNDHNDYKRQIASYAYKLLSQWKYCPGTETGGSFNFNELTNWITEVYRISEISGHTEIAQSIIGRILTNAPLDPSGLWIHKEVAKIINGRDADIIRKSFITELYNRRGIYTFTHGQEEEELSKQFSQKANELDLNGFSRFATSMRSLSDSYKREAKIKKSEF